MLVYTLQDMEESPFSLYKNLEYEKEINELTKVFFEIPKDFRYLFQAECLITHDKETYEVKNIEPFYEGYKVEARQTVYTLQYNFLKSVNFPHKDFETIIKGILPSSWSYKIVGQIEGRRTMTADHMDSWEAIKLAVKKFDCEFKIHAEEKLIIFGNELGEDKGKCFFDDLNIKDKDITEESFDFATRIIPEGMNGLKINQINDGKDYLEDKSYCFKTITYHWKDERYTNIQNLKDEAARKLKALSRPRITIKLKVKDLSDAVGVKGQKYDVGDYVYLIDKDRKTKERYRIVAGSFYPYKPFDNDLTLANKPLDIVDDLDETIELTKEMWEETRVRFETTDEAIKSSVATAKRYTDDSFKTYKTERLQTDRQIYEKISESTTYVDPKTGQTKPIIDKQLEVDKTIDGIRIDVTSAITDFKFDAINTKALVTKLKTDFKIQAGEISSKVSRGEVISEINQSPEQIKIDASKIDLTGNVSVVGSFATKYNSGDPGINIWNNQIEFADNRWEGKKFGRINVTKEINSDDIVSLNIGHYDNGRVAISYYDKETKLWNKYVTFDHYHRGNNMEGYSSIFVYSPTLFTRDVRLFGTIHLSDKIIIGKYNSGAISIGNIQGDGLYIKEDGSVYINRNNTIRKVLTE